MCASAIARPRKNGKRSMTAWLSSRLVMQKESQMNRRTKVIRRFAGFKLPKARSQSPALRLCSGIFLRARSIFGKKLREENTIKTNKRLRARGGSHPRSTFRALFVNYMKESLWRWNTRIADKSYSRVFLVIKFWVQYLLSYIHQPGVKRLWSTFYN